MLICGYACYSIRFKKNGRGTDTTFIKNMENYAPELLHLGQTNENPTQDLSDKMNILIE